MSGEMRATLLRSVVVWGLLLAVYLSTYTGQALSGDEQRLFDGVHSLVKYCHLELNYTNDLRPYQTIPGDAANLSVDSEPMQVYVTAPLVWLATVLPGVGLMQAAWVLNAIVTAATGALLYAYGVTLGYSGRASLGVALAYGLGTYAWAYSQMYFREPLFTLLALAAAFALERWRQGLGQRRRYANAGWLALGMAALLGALFTKEAGLLLAPMLAAVSLPAISPANLSGLRTGRAARRVIAGLVIGMVVVVAALLMVEWLAPSSRLASGLRQLGEINLSYTIDALAAYLLSPGFSVWAFSPVLLLTLPGAMKLWRGGRHRQVIAPLVMLTAYVVGYALLRGSLWYGGAGWGPRFLVPTTPFLALLLLPVAEAWLERAYRPVLMAIIVGVTAQSVMSQVLSVTVPTRAFPNYLYSEGLAVGSADGLTPGRMLLPWQAGVWHPVYLPHVVSAHQSTAPTEIAWVVNGTGPVILPGYAMLVVAAILAWRMARPPRSVGRGRVILIISGVLVVAAVVTYAGLRVHYADPRFGGNKASLWEGLNAIRAQLRPGDAILLGNRTYRPFFMNYYRDAVPIYVLPNAPGEILDIGTPPEVISTLPEERAHPYQQIMLAKVARSTTRWWFVTEYTPFSTERFRATEHYLARHYFAGVTEVNLPDLRVIRYASASAPPDSIPPWPSRRYEADFGAAWLVGLDLPTETTITPGAMLPVSLLWRHDGWPEGVDAHNYSVNVSLVDAAGRVWAQRAETPQGSFGDMRLWRPGGYYRDNVALDLPPDLPPGTYDLWALIFDWRDNRKLPVTLGDGRRAEHVILATLQVRPWTPPN
jgi:hypothetical protein